MFWGKENLEWLGETTGVGLKNKVPEVRTYPLSFLHAWPPSSPLRLRNLESWRVAGKDLSRSG